MFQFFIFLISKKTKQTNHKQRLMFILFIYELYVGQELQLEVHHVSFWHVDDFLTKKFKRKKNNIKDENFKYIHVL